MILEKTECCAIHQHIVTQIKTNMLDYTTLNDLSEFFKVMGDRTRLQILFALEQSELCVCDIASLLNLTKSAVSHQLKFLRTAKLVKSRREGKNIYYSLDDSHIQSLLDIGLEHIQETS